MPPDLKEFAKGFPGVEIHGDRIRINFYYQGVRCFETFDINVNKTNIKWAAGKREAIRHEISTGTFDYGKHFPDSSKLQLFGTKVIPTFDIELAKLTKIKASSLRPKRFKTYKGQLDNYILPRFSGVRLDQIKLSDLEQWRVLELSHLANETINEIVQTVKQVLNAAMADKVISHNPALYLKSLKKRKSDKADPFEMTEIIKMAEADTHNQSERNAFIFACFTGMRLSEYLALAWEDVNWHKRTILVRRSITRSKFAATKTGSSTREVELLDQAYDMLVKQRPLSEMLKPVTVEVTQDDNKTVDKQSLRFIFPRTKDGKHWNDGANYNTQFFDGFQKVNKIRRRTPNQARHTFASQCLIRGVRERWIMKQMGWTSMKMFEEHYAKWIESETVGMAKTVSNLFRIDPIGSHEESKNTIND